MKNKLRKIIILHDSIKKKFVLNLETAIKWRHGVAHQITEH